MDSNTKYVPDSSIVRVFRTARTPVLTTREVADELPLGQKMTCDRLTVLASGGVLARKRVGDRSVWWWPGDGDRPNRPPSGTTDRPVVDEYEPRAGRHDSVAGLDLPGGDETRQRRRDAIEAVYGYLQVRGAATRSALVANVFPDHPASYGSPDTWWQFVRDQLAELPDVEPPDRGRRWWRYVDGASRTSHRENEWA